MLPWQAFSLRITFYASYDKSRLAVNGKNMLFFMINRGVCVIFFEKSFSCKSIFLDNLLSIMSILILASYEDPILFLHYIFDYYILLCTVVCLLVYLLDISLI